MPPVFVEDPLLYNVPRGDSWPLHHFAVSRLAWGPCGRAWAFCPRSQTHDMRGDAVWSWHNTDESARLGWLGEKDLESHSLPLTHTYTHRHTHTWFLGLFFFFLELKMSQFCLMSITKNLPLPFSFSYQAEYLQCYTIKSTYTRTSLHRNTHTPLTHSAEAHSPPLQSQE